jgi:hypothetical protein
MHVAFPCPLADTDTRQAVTWSALQVKFATNGMADRADRSRDPGSLQLSSDGSERRPVERMRVIKHGVQLCRSQGLKG